MDYKNSIFYKEYIQPNQQTPVNNSTIPEQVKAFPAQSPAFPTDHANSIVNGMYNAAFPGITKSQMPIFINISGQADTNSASLQRMVFMENENIEAKYNPQKNTTKVYTSKDKNSGFDIDPSKNTISGKMAGNNFEFNLQKDEQNGKTTINGKVGKVNYKNLILERSDKDNNLYLTGKSTDPNNPQKEYNVNIKIDDNGWYRMQGSTGNQRLMNMVDFNQDNPPNDKFKEQLTLALIIMSL